MSDSQPPPVLADSRDFYRVVRRDPEWAVGEIIPVAMGILRSLASMNHRDHAQHRAAEAVAQIDAAVAARFQELDL